MGCGGSKQDVAAGNTVTRSFLRKSSSAAAAKSCTDANATKEVAADHEVGNGGEAGVKGAPVAEAADVEKDQSSDEYFSSRRQIEGPEAVTGSEGPAGYYSPNEDSEAQVVASGHVGKPADGSGRDAVGSPQAKEEESSEAKEDEEMSTKEDDGESIGKHSTDFKETICVIEEVGGEVIITENEGSEETAETVEKPSSI